MHKTTTVSTVPFYLSATGTSSEDLEAHSNSFTASSGGASALSKSRGGINAFLMN